ncbi:L-rhamnose mutarotase [Streptomyces coerulescens]|uniref:L-rhamnose mutarotase n=1 Tax=Streptomyces coerulescens TaxID=29304 RepID=A0ABW0CZX4_STRCD
MRVALHTKVRADCIEEYEAAHRAVPAELTKAIRAAGATQWTIWRSGTDLFHVIDVDGYEGMITELGRLPVNAAWQTRMAGLVEVAHDYSAGGADTPLPVVWEL